MRGTGSSCRASVVRGLCRQDGEGCSVPFREASALAVDHEVPMEASGKTEKDVMTLMSLPKRTIED